MSTESQIGDTSIVHVPVGDMTSSTNRYRLVSFDGGVAEFAPDDAGPWVSAIDHLRALAEPASWADAWHQAAERICTIIGVSSAGNPDEMLQAVREWSDAQKPIATLHDDGYFTWTRDEFRLRYERPYAGWRMSVYAAPAAQQERKPLPEALHTFLDAAAGEGLELAGVDAADLYVALFPERFAQRIAGTTAGGAMDGGEAR